MIASVNTEPPKEKPKEFNAPFSNIPSDVIALLIQNYDITAQDLTLLGCRWDARGKGRLAIPIKTRFGNHIGWTLRSFFGEKPKAINHLRDSYAPCMSVYFNGTRNYKGEAKAPVTILVEDHLSAIKACKFANVDSVAILGTNLNNSKINALVEFKPRKLLIALDQDAKSVAAKYACQLQGIVDNVSVLQLEKDIKDMAPSDIRRMLNE